MNFLFKTLQYILVAFIAVTGFSACQQNKAQESNLPELIPQESSNQIVESPAKKSIVNNPEQPLKVSILGDSYSTFEGYIPDEFISWYKTVPKKGRVTDVTKVEQTWWDIFLKSHGWKLEKNNSYSGSTICNTGYAGNDYSDRSFVSRVDQLGNPDLILVYGGTNDSWANSPLGEFVYENWIPKQLYSFRPATAYMLSELKRIYPDAQIFFMINGPEITKNEIISSIEEICDHYGIHHIIIKDLQKLTDHPDQVGMQQIVTQLDAALGL